MDQPRVVILGGGFAGLLAAKRLRGVATDRLLLNESETFVERVRFHEVASGRDVARHAIPDLLAGSGTNFRLARVASVDLSRREVVTATERIGYDHLIYALGSTIQRDRVPGVRAHAASVASEPDAQRLAQRLRLLAPSSPVVVCGGGLTAIELASEIAEGFPQLRVSLVTQGTLGPGLSPRGREFVRKSLRGLGVTVREETQVVRVDAGAVVTGTEAIPSECTVWAASFTVPAIAKESGLAVNPRGQVLVDPTLRSISHPEVFAAGDAAIPVTEPGAPIRMGCATAMPMAALAATNLRALLEGRPLTDFGYRYLAQFVSLGRKNALGQLVRGDDSPRGIIFTGRFAAWLKEITFRYNLRGLRTGFYPFPSKMLAPRRVEPKLLP